MQIPSGKEICEKRLYNLIDKVEKVEVDESKISSFLPEIYKKLEWLSREELIKHFVSVEFNRFLEYYKNAGDLNTIPDKGRDEEKKRKGKGSYTRMYINIGTKSGMNPSHLIGLINEALKRNDIDIGKVDVQRNFSFFEIDKDFDRETLKAFENTVYEGISIKVDISEGEIKGDRSRSRNRGKSQYNDKPGNYKKKSQKNSGYHGRKKR